MKSYSPFRAIFLIILTAAIAASIFMFFSPGDDINIYLKSNLSKTALPEDGEVFIPTLLPNDQSRIGIVAGHWGFDSGHICGPELNNIREIDVNLRIATMVRDILTQKGYAIDLMQEFDPLLSNYTGLALLAIHNDTCEYINETATGFKVSSTTHVAYPAESKKFNECLIDRYSRDTGLEFRGNTISSDSEMFYAYNMINDYTTASIIETGYLNLDYRILTEKTERIAQGIADGILCYVNNETVAETDSSKSISSPTAVPELETRFILPGIDHMQD